MDESEYPAWCLRIRRRLAEMRPQPRHRDIAVTVGVTAATVGLWLRGEARPVGHALALARALGLSDPEALALGEEVEA